MAGAGLSDAQYAALGLIAPTRRAPIPVGPQDAASVLDAALERTPDAEALVGRHARYTYAELEQRINAAAAGLVSLGVRPGAHVACSMSNHPEIFIALMAVMRLGCVWIGIAPKLAPAEKAYMLRDSETEVFLAEPAGLAEVQAQGDLPLLRHWIDVQPGAESDWGRLIEAHLGAGRPQVEIDPWAPAAIAYTSGTTGFPKGAVHSQRNLVLLGACRTAMGDQEFYAAGRRYGLVQANVILNVFVVGVVPTWLTGGACICLDRNDAAGVAEWIARERISCSSLASATVYDLATMPQIDPADLATLKFFTMGGGPAPPELRSMVKARLGITPHVSYGMTEAPGQATQSSLAEPCAPQASGRAHPIVRLAVMGPDDHLLPAGETGEVCIAPAEEGPWAGLYNPMLGYWKKPEATVKALRGGWYHTGDLGHLDEDNAITLTARMNDVILRGGANIYPAEIERVLNGVGEVRACAVLGRPDARLGEVVEAFVQLMPDVPRETAEAALQAACRAQLARYKAPAVWTFVDDMPRNAMNKIIKSRLRELHPA